MKQLIATIYITVIISLILGSCKKSELEVLQTSDIQKVKAQTRITVHEQLYIAKLTGVAEGNCIATKLGPRSFSGIPYCVKWATSDFVEITIKDNNTGLPVPGAKVSGSWSGAYTFNSISSLTDKKGIVILNGLSGYTSSVTFTVNTVSANGGVYDAALNFATSVTIR